MDLRDYQKDGANYQSRAVLAYLQSACEIKESWDAEFKHYTADIHIARWENCREQGYIAYLRTPNYKQLNIIWFEHRNSDSICAVKWEQTSFPNSLNIDTAKFGKVYKDKYDTSHCVSYGAASSMADWIIGEFKAFWLANAKKPIQIRPATSNDQTEAI